METSSCRPSSEDRSLLPLDASTFADRTSNSSSGGGKASWETAGAEGASRAGATATGCSSGCGSPGFSNVSVLRPQRLPPHPGPKSS